MAYELSFTSDFFGDCYNSAKPDEGCNPITVCEALMAMPEQDWADMCRDVFDCEPEFVELDTALQKVIETNTCSNLDSPVEVWIDDEGFWTIQVFEDP